MVKCYDQVLGILGDKRTSIQGYHENKYGPQFTQEYLNNLTDYIDSYKDLRQVYVDLLKKLEPPQPDQAEGEDRRTGAVLQDEVRKGEARFAALAPQRKAFEQITGDWYRAQIATLGQLVGGHCGRPADVPVSIATDGQAYCTFGPAKPANALLTPIGPMSPILIAATPQAAAGPPPAMTPRIPRIPPLSPPPIEINDGPRAGAPPAQPPPPARTPAAGDRPQQQAEPGQQPSGAGDKPKEQPESPLPPGVQEAIDHAKQAMAQAQEAAARAQLERYEQWQKSQQYEREQERLGLAYADLARSLELAQEALKAGNREEFRFRMGVINRRIEFLEKSGYVVRKNLQPELTKLENEGAGLMLDDKEQAPPTPKESIMDEIGPDAAPPGGEQRPNFGPIVSAPPASDQTTATPVSLFVKATESVLAGQPEGKELGQQVVKLVPLNEPALPRIGRSQTARSAEDMGYDKPPVQCTTDAKGECRAEVPPEERPIYGFPRGPVTAYRAALALPQNSGGVVMNPPGAKTKLPDPPSGAGVTPSRFMIGKMPVMRLAYSGPSNLMPALADKYGHTFGKNYQTDFCAEKKPGPPLGMAPVSFSALGNDLPRAAISLRALPAREVRP
jgi:hypothetical protein